MLAALLLAQLIYGGGVGGKPVAPKVPLQAANVGAPFYPDGTSTTLHLYGNRNFYNNGWGDSRTATTTGLTASAGAAPSLSAPFAITPPFYQAPIGTSSTIMGVGPFSYNTVMSSTAMSAFGFSADFVACTAFARIAGNQLWQYVGFISNTLSNATGYQLQFYEQDGLYGTHPQGAFNWAFNPGNINVFTPNGIPVSDAPHLLCFGRAATTGYIQLDHGPLTSVGSVPVNTPAATYWTLGTPVSGGFFASSTKFYEIWAASSTPSAASFEAMAQAYLSTPWPALDPMRGCLQATVSLNGSSIAQGVYSAATSSRVMWFSSGTTTPSATNGTVSVSLWPSLLPTTPTSTVQNTLLTQWDAYAGTLKLTNLTANTSSTVTGFTGFGPMAGASSTPGSPADGLNWISNITMGYSPTACSTSTPWP